MEKKWEWAVGRAGQKERFCWSCRSVEGGRRELFEGGISILDISFKKEQTAFSAGAGRSAGNIFPPVGRILF
jgi:hypothetical protein